MAQTTSLTTVQRLYLAYYGRPADPGGLVYWADKLDAAQGSLAGIVDAFANSAESRALYGSTSGNAALVTKVYQFILGREPELQGLNYYVDQINRGRLTLVNAALSIANGAQNTDLVQLQQREAAAAQFTAALDLPKEQAAYVGDAKAQIVRDAITTITAEAGTLSSFTNGLDALVLRLLGERLVQGSVTAGPVVEGHGLQVTAYDARGNVLGSGALNPDGSYRITIERDYSGPILVRVVDASAEADYVDEARGKPVDLTSDLRALSSVSGPGSYNVNINPITELITRRVGLQGGDNATSQLVLGATTPEQIQTATQEIATALGLGNVNPVTTTPVTTVTATGSANPAADTLGRVLAAISGQESGQGASTDKVLNTLLGSLTGSGAQTQLTPTAQRDLLVGAATADRSGAVGVTNSLAQNLGTPASTAAQIQNTVKQLADLADKKITTTTLTPADFAAIGVTGVTNENLNAVLNQVVQRPNGAEQVNSTGKVQDLVPAPAPAPAPTPEPPAPPPPAAPPAPTAVILTPVGGTVVANAVNTTNTGLQFAATITAGQATGGKAEFFVGTTKVGEDASIAAGDTSVSYTTINTSDGPSTPAALQAAITAGGVVTVKLSNAAGASATSTVGNPTLLVDYVAPTVAITDDKANTITAADGNDGAFTNTFTFSESVTGFTADDVVVTNGTKGTFTPTTEGTNAGKVYTLVVTPTAGLVGNVTVALSGGRANDAAGNGNAAATNNVQAVSLYAFTAQEDTAKVLATADFGTYPAPLTAVKITTLPDKGALEYNSTGTTWVAVTAEQEISKADLDAGKLRYTAAANENGSAYASLAFKVDVGTGFSTTAYTLTANVTAVNDAPVRTAGTYTAISVDEDSANFTAASLGLSNFTYGPGGGTDEASQTLTYKITSIPSFVSLKSGNTDIGISGLRGISLTDLRALAYITQANQSGTGNITVTVTDSGSSTTPNVNLLTETLSITVNAVNDAPVNTVPTGRVVQQATATAITGLSVADVDIGSSDLTVTLSAANGTVTVATANGVTISNNGSASVQLVGSLTAVNAALAATNGVVYLGNANFTGSETFTMVSSDGGATGSGGTLTDTDTVALTVSAAGVTIVTAANLDLATGVISTTAQDVGAANNANLTYQVAGTNVASGTNADNAQGARVLATQPSLVLQNTLSGVLKVTNGTQTVDTAYSVTYGTNGADTATATANSLLYGFGGDDNLTGSAGNDTIYGGAGADTINAGAGADTVGVVLSATSPFLDADRINLGGNAGDSLRFGPTVTDPNTRPVTYFQGEIAIGFVPDDVGNGTGTLRLIAASGAAKAVNGYNNTNFDTTTHLELNNTQVSIIASPETASLRLRLVGLDANHLAVAGGDRGRGFQKGDFALPPEQNTVGAYYGAHFLSSGNDNFTTPTLESNAQYVNAGVGHDTVSSGSGQDFLEGGAGDDSLSGGASGDVLVGGSGNDTLLGGEGRDTLIGGAGSDVFVVTSLDINSSDVVFDFQLGTDRLSDGSPTPAFFGGVGTQTTLQSFSGSSNDYETFVTAQLTANQVANGVIAIRQTNTADNTTYTRIVVENGNSNTAALTITLAGNIGTPGTTLVSEFYGVTAPTGTTIATPTARTTAALATDATTSFNDPLFDSQWNLKNTGQRYTSDDQQLQNAQTAQQKIDAAKAINGGLLLDINPMGAWAAGYTGRGIIQSVSDDGFDLAHEDIQNNLLANLAYNGATNARAGATAADAATAFSAAGNFNTSGSTAHQHGTVVGTIAANEANNGKGIVGIAFNSQLIPAAVLDTTQAADMARHLAYLRANNVAVSLNSYGADPAFSENYGNYNGSILTGQNASPQANLDLGQQIRQAAEQGRGGLGMVLEFSAGNERATKADSAMTNGTSSRYVIAVGAVNEVGNVASYGSRGTNILVSAFGGDGTGSQTVNAGFGIVAGDNKAQLNTGYNNVDNNATANIDEAAYSFFNTGTSYSGPTVGGVAALMLQANPNLGFRDVSTILALTARKVGAQATNQYVTNGATNWNLGGMHHSDEGVGYGLVDATAAVRLAEQWTLAANTTTRGTTTNWKSLSGSNVAQTPQAIPDNDNTTGLTVTATVATPTNAADLISIERVEFELDLGASKPQELRAVVTSPSGTAVTLFIEPRADVAWPGVFSIGSSAFLGEKAEGDWTLKLFDMTNNGTVNMSDATFKSFKVNAWGSAASSDTQYYFTREYTATNQVITDRGGIDTINAAAVHGSVTLNLNYNQTNSITNDTGTPGTFTIFNQQASQGVIENAIGGGGNDTITGNAADNVLRGAWGNDTLSGGDGNDTLIGGIGQDNLTGGAGNDVFVITETDMTAATGSFLGDTITDFVSGTDKIQLDVTALSRLTGWAGNTAGLTGYTGAQGSNAFLLAGAANAAYAQLLYSGGVLSLDVDGSGSTAAVTLVTLTGQTTPTLALSDFIFTGAAQS